MRETPAGSLIFPHRGKPPEAPAGYEKDYGDPYIFHPILEACDFRELIEVKSSCCPNGVPRIRCNQKESLVTRKICKECTLPKQA